MFFQNALAGKNQFWRYVVSFFTIMLSWQGLGAVPLLIVILLNDPWSLVKMGGKLDFEAMGVDANLGFFVLFLMFVFGLAGLVISIRFIHQKPVCKVITGRSRISWSRFFSGALIWGGMLGIFLAVQLHLFPERYEMNFSASRFLPLLVMAVIMVPMQTGFEEILFRGYYMQAISLISKNRWAPLLITSAIFGLLHIFNPEVGEYGLFLAMPQYLLFGLFFGIISVMDEGIELAMGAHAANNLFIALFTTSASAAFQTPALYVVKEVDPTLELYVFLAMIFIFLFVASLVFRWKDWGKIRRKIDYPGVVPGT